MQKGLVVGMKDRRYRPRYVGKLFGVSLVLMAGVFSTAIASLPAFAANEAFSAVTNKAATISTALPITDLSINGDGNDSLVLTLSAPSGSFQFGSTVATVTGSGKQVTLSGTRADINATLATLTYTPDRIGALTIKASLGSNISNVLVDPDNGHGYVIVHNDCDNDDDDDCQDEFTWYEARDAAQDYTYGGASGYLATITSQQENNFIYNNLQDNGWIGASDEENEGDWQWVTGPELGTQFWQGNDSGHTVDGNYANWAEGEPNNSDGNENCALFWNDDGGWNDLNCNDTTTSFVVEFGSGVNVPNVIDTQFTVTASGNTRTISTCQQLEALGEVNRFDTIKLTADIDCHNQEVEPLFQDSDKPFSGTLDGQGHTIKNVVVKASDLNYRAGLFNFADSATFTNLKLNTIKVNSNGDYNGALISFARNTEITAVHAKNIQIIGGGGDTGGLVGELYAEGSGEKSVITHSSVEGVIAGSSYCTGGLVGYFQNYSGATTTIAVSYTDMDITSSDWDVGGLVGCLYSGTEINASTSVTIEDVYAWGNVQTSEGEAGGLIGYADAWNDYNDSLPLVQITLQRAYSAGSVSALKTPIGGITGALYASEGTKIILNNMFAMGKVAIQSEDDDDGGISILSVNEEQGGISGHTWVSVPDEQLEINGVYYDKTRTGQETAGPLYSDEEDASLDPFVTPVNSNNAQPLYFINNNTNAPLNTWNFTNIWVRNSTVPPTFSAVTDGDEDGIDDAVEAAAPNNGDGNKDGTPDNMQPNVASFVNTLTHQYVTIAVDSSCVLTQASAFAEDTSHGDTAYDYHSGLLGFTAECSEDSTQVKLYYYGVSSYGVVLRKYNPTTHTYFTVNNAVLSKQSIGGKQVAVVTYTVTDGGKLDIDGVENGVIVDPVGLAAATSAAKAPNTGFLRSLGIENGGAAASISAGLVVSTLLASIYWLVWHYRHARAHR